MLFATGLIALLCSGVAVGGFLADQDDGDRDKPTPDGGTDTSESDAATSDDGDFIREPDGDTTGADATDGNDSIHGSRLGDLLRGLGGNDDMFGRDGDDTLEGGAGDDVLEGEDGDDSLSGGQGMDWLNGGEGADSLDGGDGDDDLVLTTGDTATGGDGSDLFYTVFDADEDPDQPAPEIVDFQPGVDRLVLEFDATADDLPDITLDTDSIPGSTVVGSADVVMAVLNGTTGVSMDDIALVALDAGGETIVDGDGHLPSEEDGATPDAAEGDDLMDGGTANDMLRAREELSDIFGRGGPDALTAGPGDDRLVGHSGNDAIFGDNGDDSLEGASGHDELYGDAGNDVLRGGAGRDLLAGGDGDDDAAGGADDDMLFGGDGDDALQGDDGDDHLQGGFGADTLEGGAGNDRLDGTFSSESNMFGPFDEDEGDVLDGGAGDDIIMAGTDDLIFVGAGADTVTTGAYIDPDGEAPLISDFDPAEDVIEVMFDPALTPDPVITVVDFPDGSGADILLNGELVLKANGAQGLDPGTIALRQIDLPLASQGV
ncbi:MAG: hypothetical protein JJ938_06175 [Roseicyclus sp.]|nr:hypothetical protein [Roseicyclus sp.]MBO6624448.1 hypothetical protein [Roseicyclus sp.]MBO6920659.1 hypothetical protein [Roseicyclus sp.]